MAGLDLSTVDEAIQAFQQAREEDQAHPTSWIRSR